MNKLTRKAILKKAILAFIFCFSLVATPLSILTTISSQQSSEVFAADYSGVSGGFSRNKTTGEVTAHFTVTDNGLNMRGWLLCLFSSKPSVDSNNKLNNSNDIHPYQYTDCAHYFFASNTAQTGNISVTWSGNFLDQKNSSNWSPVEVVGNSSNLKDYINDGTNWHLVIGPRHYNTSWGGSGVGQGSDGYWENCDYYVGALNEVFPDEDKDMSVSVSSYSGVYDGQNHSISVKVSDPSSGYTIKYRTNSSGDYNLTSNPSFDNVVDITVYFEVTATGYKTYTGSGTVKITKATPNVTAPTAKSGLVYNTQSQDLINAGSTTGGTLKYSLDNSTYSSDIPKGLNAGTYTVYYKVEATHNYNGVSAKSLSVNIAKANPTVTAPEASIGLKYTSEAQDLVSAGSTSGGTIKYSLDGENYSTTIPQATLVDTYTVYYLVEGDTNYNGVEVNTISVSISPNDKTALGEAIEQSNAYLLTISEDFPEIAEEFNIALKNAIEVNEDKNKTVFEIAYARQSLIDAYNLAHASIVDTLIINIGEVRYTNSCLNAIIEAETAYSSLNEEQIELLSNYDDLLKARNLYDKFAALSDVIAKIGDITYDEDTLNRINAALEAFEALSEEEQLLIPTLYNELKYALDIYNVLKVIDELGDVEYSDEYKAKLEEARNAFDALDETEQAKIYNYKELLNKEKIYENVDKFVNLVKQIDEQLEYVGTHNEEIDKAREAYAALSEDEQKLVPAPTYDALVEAENEYEELKVEHERKQIEDREAGVAIAIEGGSGIPDTVSIEINNNSSSSSSSSSTGGGSMEDTIDYQTINNMLPDNLEVSSTTEIKLYQEVDGEIVEVALEDLDEGLEVTIKLDIPEDVDDQNFKIVLLDKNNNLVEVKYDYDPVSRVATIKTNKLGTFAILSINEEPTVAKNGIRFAVILAVSVASGLVATFIFSIRGKRKEIIG